MQVKISFPRFETATFYRILDKFILRQKDTESD